MDAIDKVDLKTVHLLQRRQGLTVHSIAGTQHYTFPMNTEVAPFNDNNVRLALKHAINREEMVEKILFGFGVAGNDHPIGRGQRFFARDLEQRVYDPDKAKHYLKKAGMDSLAVDLSVADVAFAGAIDAGVLYAESAKAAGIDLTVVREPNDGYWSNVWQKKPWSACYWSGRPTADWMFSTTYAAGVPWNDTNWEHEKFNELLKVARDGARRVEAARHVRGDAADPSATRAARSFRCSPPTSSPPPTRSRCPTRWRRTGTRTASAGWSAGRSPESASSHRSPRAGASTCRASPRDGLRMQGPAVAGARVALAAANRAAPGNDPETIGEHEFAGFFGDHHHDQGLREGLEAG